MKKDKEKIIVKDVKVDSVETEFTVSMRNDLGLDEETIEDKILDKVAEKFVEENYDNILEFIDIPKLANKVGILIQNKLSIEILRKELELGLVDNTMDNVHDKKYLFEDKK